VGGRRGVGGGEQGKGDEGSAIMTNEMEWKGSVKCHIYSLEAFPGPFYDDRKRAEWEGLNLYNQLP
jgi:hypothetical protein